MTLQETHIYIRCPIGELISRLGQRPVERVSTGSDGEMGYLVANPDGTPWFGLMTDLNAPTGQNWTQLLHAAPDNAESVAKTLKELKINAEMLESATDWDDNPLIALKPITDILRASREQAPTHSFGPIAR